MRGLQTSLLAWCFVAAELTVFLVQPVPNISLEGVPALAGSHGRIALFHEVLGETRPVLPSLVDQSMIQCLPFLLS